MISFSSLTQKLRTLLFESRVFMVYCLLCFAVVMPQFAYAEDQINPCAISFCIPGTYNANYTNTSLSPGGRAAYIIGDMAGYLTFFINSIAIIFILWGAFMMLTAQGDSQKFKNGLQAIQYAIAGMVISVIAYGIVSSIIQFFNSTNG